MYLSHTFNLYDMIIKVYEMICTQKRTSPIEMYEIQLQTSTTSPMTSGASYLLLASPYSGPWYESPSSCHPYKNPHYVHNPSI